MNANHWLKQAAFVVLALASSGAWAAAAGTVSNLSGTLTAQRPDGSARILGQKSEVNPGDTLTTQPGSYAQVSFTDGSSMTLRPETQVRIDQYNFVKARPQDDSSFLRLVKGGFRTVTGLVGKRGNQDAYKIGTNTATIGIRGSSLNAFQGATLLIEVQDGIYAIVDNKTGATMQLNKGEFGEALDGVVRRTADAGAIRQLRWAPVFRKNMTTQNPVTQQVDNSSCAP